MKALSRQAMIIAFTSDMIPRLVYYWSFSVGEHGNHTMEGYINNSLSVFDTSDFTDKSRPMSSTNNTICRFDLSPGIVGGGEEEG